MSKPDFKARAESLFEYVDEASLKTRAIEAIRQRLEEFFELGRQYEKDKREKGIPYRTEPSGIYQGVDRTETIHAVGDDEVK